MTLAPRLRKAVLTAHVTASVGWLGAVGGFLALSIVGLASDDPQTVRAAYLAMNSIGWFVLVPLSLASLLTGLVQSLGTKWGLFVHYWVVVKLVINVVASIILVLYMQTLDSLARIARESLSRGELTGLRDPSPVLHSGAAIMLLLVATTLAVYKPRGMTKYGQRKQHRRHAAAMP
jgi:hypothetical protein